MLLKDAEREALGGKMSFLVSLHITHNMNDAKNAKKKKKKNQDLAFSHIVSLLFTEFKAKEEK